MPEQSIAKPPAFSDCCAMRLPKHIGVIPDGNRRWAEAQGLSKEKGYALGVDPGLQVFKLCQQAGIQELSYYGFTVDNVKRASLQRKAFTDACVQAAQVLMQEDVELLVLGNADSAVFPEELLSLTTRTKFGKGGVKVNLLVNYGWEWDLNSLKKNEPLKSAEVSRIDLILRWGGKRRLSGFLPVQSVYADFYVRDELWPDFQPEHFQDALEWYQEQDVTLGG